MDKNIQNKNLIPGCEKLTQATEIKALQKYLKAGIGVRDSMLDLEKDNLGTPSSDPRVKDIDDLEHTRLDISGNKEQVLPDSALPTPGSTTKSPGALDSTKLGLKKGSDPKLSGVREDIPGSTTSNSPGSLETDLEKLDIRGSQVSELESDRLELEIQSGPDSLESLVEYLDKGEDIESLPGDTEKIEDKNNITELPGDAEVIPGDPATIDSLEKGRIDLERGEDIVVLPEESEKLSDVQEIGELEHTQVSLGVTEKVTSLETAREDIHTDIDDGLELETIIKKLGQTLKEVESLESEEVKLRGTSSDIVLPDILEKIIPKTPITELPDSREDIDTSEATVEFLESTKEELKGTEDLETLDSTLEKLDTTGSGGIVSLESFKEELKGKVDDDDLELKTGREELVQAEEKVTELPGELEELIQGEELVTELPGELENLPVTDNITELPEESEKLPGEDNNSPTDLEDTQIGLLGNHGGSTETLEDYLGTLEVTEKPDALEDTRLELLENQGGDIDDLEDTQIGLLENEGGSVDSLEDTQIGMASNEGGDIDGLEDTQIGMLSNSGGSVDSLEDYLETFQDTRENSLSDVQIVRPENTKNSQSGYIDKSGLLDAGNDIFDLPGYYKGFTNGVLEPGQLPKPTGTTSRFDRLDSMLGGTFASLDSSEGLGISKTPAEDAQTEITSGSGDIMFVRPIENPESTTENDIQELPGDYIPRNPSDGTSDTPEALSDTIIQGPKANDPDSLGSTKITGPTQNDPENLADTKILRGGESDESSELPDTKILRGPGGGIEFTSAEELMNYQKDKSDGAILKYITIKGKRIPLVDESTGTDSHPRSYWNELMKYLGTNDLSVAMEFQKTIDELKKHGNWGKKVAAYLGAILSKNSHFYSSIPEKDINTYKAVVLGGLKYSGKEVEGLYTDASLKKVNPANSGDVEGLEEKRLGTPSYKLPSFSLASGISASSFLRERAENTVGKLAKGSTKKLLLDETLALLVETRDLLEKTTGTYRHRLPGNEDNLGTITSGLVNGGVSLSSAASIGAKLLGNILNTSGTANPLNRPEKDGSERRLGGGAATVWETSTGKTVVFNDDYLQGEGIEITLKELCDQSPSDILSVEDLKNVLQNSKYITTAGKVTDNINRSRVMTLDSNHIWEMRLFPYTGELNGNYSFLPPIREINTMNYMQHGIRTSWSDWIPANSFDLQPKRMVQKTLGLYDGEISYPVSMEFTNELRITLVDDQYKSWKQYFEKCAECSVYLSESHPKEYYTDLDPSTLTPVVRGSIAPAMYKNITFRCLIYVMTPQFSTIKKFDLLVLLKDFAEEWQGESDASSPDLSLSFSVVGENPSDEVVVEKASTKLTKRENTQSKDYTSILSSGLGKVVSVLT
jgi:hypothetical protein